MTTPLFLLRCAQLGLHQADLDELTLGMVYDMMAEQSNDGCDEWVQLATQEDFDKF